MSIIDAHVHLETRILPVDSLLRNMDRLGIARAVLIPHLTDPPETRKSDLPLAVQRFMFYRRWLRPLGLAITRSMYRERGQWNMWFRRGQAQPRQFTLISRPDNAPVAAAIRAHPDRFSGWIFINPGEPDAMDELARWREVPGMAGVKLHPFWHQFPIRQAERLLAETERLQMPLLIHLGIAERDTGHWLMASFPTLTIIFAHLGIPFYRDLWNAARDNPRVYFDVASTYHVDAFLVREAVRYLGADRIVFGTDAPYAHPDVAERIMRWVRATVPDERGRRLIFHDNWLRLCGKESGGAWDVPE